MAIDQEAENQDVGRNREATRAGEVGGPPGLLGNAFSRLARPLRGLLKRYGSSSLKRAVWNSEFRTGKHIHHNITGDYRSDICDNIERYCVGGDILDLGCSDGHVGLGLNPWGYSTYTGVDISEIAIRSAYAKLKMFGSDRWEKNRFEVHDIACYTPAKHMDVILFKDSLYYIRRMDLVDILLHYQEFLKPNGVFVVQMDDIARHGWIREIILSRFGVMADHICEKADYMRLIFR